MIERGGEPHVPGQEPRHGGRFSALLIDADGLLPVIARLDDAAYMLKAGRVGGAESEPGSREIEASLAARVLDAALAGEIEWELDPDFGYEVAASVPGVEFPDDGLLMPRLLYSRADRVYEHAAIVPRVREQVRELTTPAANVPPDAV